MHGASALQGLRARKLTDVRLSEHEKGKEDTAGGGGGGAGGSSVGTVMSQLRTEFFAWSCRYFTEPLMRDQEQDPESMTHQLQQFRYLSAARCHRQATEDQKKYRVAKFEDLVFTTRSVSAASALKFHPYEPYLAVADKDHISIWDWELGTRLNTFSNRNQRHTRVTYTEFINSHDQTLLITGSDDGVVKVYRNFLGEENVGGGVSAGTSSGGGASAGSSSVQPCLVTAWLALSEMIPTAKGSGMVMDYDSSNAMLFASGDVRQVSHWDLTKELKVNDMPTGADSCMTNLSIDPNNRSVLVGGCGDGTVRVFDIRLSSSTCNVLTFREHPTWVLKAYTLQSYPHRVVSASTNGDIRVWDRRMNESVRLISTTGGLTALDVHQYCEVIASGSVQQWINVYSHVGDTLSTIKYHEGFMGQRIGQVTCLAFHPLKLKLAVGGMDQCISVYSASPSTADNKKR